MTERALSYTFKSGDKTDLNWRVHVFHDYNLARLANLSTGLYILLVLISYFLFFFTMSKAISVSTGPIFTIFAPYGRY